MENTEERLILVVDDEEISRDMLTCFFQDNFKVIAAEDGEEAIQKIDEYGKKISMILLDNVMPKIDGMGVLKYLNDNDYIGAVPVIMITADTSDYKEVDAFVMGVNDFIYKPYNAAIVIKRVQNIIDLFEKNRELEEAMAKLKAQET